MKRKPNAVLSFVDCLIEEDYGELLPEVLTFAAEMLDFKLTDDEIERYAFWYLSEEGEEQGFTKEDYEICIVKLQEFKEKYCFAKIGKKKK